MTLIAAFWSQVPARMAAALPAGSVPPLTNPKYRPPVERIVAGDPNSSSWARTAAGSVGPVGKEGSKPRNAETASGEGAA